MTFRSSPLADTWPTLNLESRLWAEGHRTIAGIDEVGRGAWAGPVVAAAVVFGPDVVARLEHLALVRDSKLLSPRQRDRCYDAILEHALCWGIGTVPPAVIDQMGILEATRQAMVLAVEQLCYPADMMLIDAVRLPTVAVPQRSIIKGDRISLSIAAASIVAKVTRDRWMCDLNKSVPGYGLARHKGYGTASHQEALARLGASELHRHSYAPIAAVDAQRHHG